MNLDLSPEAVTAYATAAVSVIGAIGSLVAAIMSFFKSRRLARILDDAKERETYTVCPYCKKKIHLSEMDFHLPSGALDNDLNGEAD